MDMGRVIAIQPIYANPTHNVPVKIQPNPTQPMGGPNPRPCLLQTTAKTGSEGAGAAADRSKGPENVYNET